MPKAHRSEPTPWQQWITEKMDAAGVTGADIERLTGGEITPGTVSYWKSGKNGAAPDKAIQVARVLRVSPVEALRAAGHDSIADLLDPDAPPPTETDPIVEEILSWTHLSTKVREALIAQYREDRAAALKRARATAEMLADSRNGSAA